MEVGGPLANETHAGHMRLVSKPSHFMPHISQSSPSRLGQQPQRVNHGRPIQVRNDWNHMKVQPPPSSFNSGGPHSPGNSSFSNGMSWGISECILSSNSNLLCLLCFLLGMHLNMHL